MHFGRLTVAGDDEARSAMRQQIFGYRADPFHNSRVEGLSDLGEHSSSSRALLGADHGDDDGAEAEGTAGAAPGFGGSGAALAAEETRSTSAVGICACRGSDTHTAATTRLAATGTSQVQVRHHVGPRIDSVAELTGSRLDNSARCSAHMLTIGRMPLDRVVRIVTATHPRTRPAFLPADKPPPRWHQPSSSVQADGRMDRPWSPSYS